MDPKKKKQLMIAGGAAAVLAVIVLVVRGGGGGAAPATDPSAASASPDPGPSSFADNGASMGALSSQVSELGAAVTALANRPDGSAEELAALQTLANNVNAGFADLGSQFQSLGSDPGPEAPPAQLTSAGQPAGTGAKVNTIAGNPRNGLAFITRPGGGSQKGTSVHLYESAPGKGDFGKTDNSRVRVGKPAAPKPKPKPKPAAHAAPKPAAHAAPKPPVHSSPTKNKPKRK